MAVRRHIYQQLFGSNTSLNIGDELAARVKDPLWFLARQWQTGEFEAENGGRAAALKFETSSTPFKSLHFPDDQNLPVNERSTTINQSVPLESLVEAEQNGVSKAWRDQALEYNFDIKTAGHLLSAREYYGNALDWFHFDLSKRTPVTSSQVKKEKVDVIPTQMHFAGAPHPRWWRFEEGDGYFDAPNDVEPNVLSILMPEFFYTDINNWYIAPVDLPSGSICEVSNVQITDSFGHTTTLKPISDPDWKVFELESPNNVDSGGLLMVPNIALEILHNDTVEDVRFIRDEAANMVWALEQTYQDSSGNLIINGDGVTSPSLEQNNTPAGALPEFRLTTQTPPYWIPYVPRKAAVSGAPQGDMYLRRGRTLETASQANPQYSSQIVGESIRINEEEVPRTGLRIRRIERFARGSDGSAHFWTGRVRSSGRSTVTSGMKFDFIDDDE